MKRKLFTTLLLAILMLTQFSSASAIQLAGAASITSPLDTFSSDTYVRIDWKAASLSNPTQYILIWSRIQSTPAVDYSSCKETASLNGLADASGTYMYPLAGALNTQVWEFIVTIDSATCGDPTVHTPVAVEAPMGSTYIDTNPPRVLVAIPPSLSVAPFGQQTVACKTFELWGIASDNYNLGPTEGYSGFKEWVPTTMGTFTPPAPVGTNDDLLSWVFTFQPTATGNWSIDVYPQDEAYNYVNRRFRSNLPIGAGELDDCATYPDVTGLDTEVYINYMSQLDLAHGYLDDGNFRPDNTLTRAEMAAFIEMANGVKPSDPGFGTPPASGSACDFSDVNADDWFAGWAWRACEDGFMVGLGNGLFGSNDILTRGQVVTVLDNLSKFSIPPRGGYLAVADNIFDAAWGTEIFREAAWTDVSIGDFFANGVVNAYGVGVADGTSATTFSPNQPILRGEFMKMMYRALSRVRL